MEGRAPEVVSPVQAPRRRPSEQAEQHVPSLPRVPHCVHFNKMPQLISLCPQFSLSKIVAILRYPLQRQSRHCKQSGCKGRPTER